MRKLISTFIFSILLSAIAFAQIPDGYYDDAVGLEGEELREALRAIITDGHTSNSYDGLYYDYESTDNYTNGKVWDMYSIHADGTANYWFDHHDDQCGSYGVEGDCYNREHSVPQSWFDSQYPMQADLFMVYPTDGKVNGYRSNYPYGETSDPTWTSTNGSKKGPCTYPGYTSTVFEPIDEFKGDFARTYFYVATRYKNSLSGWSGESFSGDNLSTWTKNMMLEWHRNDPVSQKEIDRNNAVYPLQHNRNPFIDHPEWVECIWATCAGVRFTSNPVTEAEENVAYTYNISYSVTDETETITATTLPSWLSFTPNTADNTAVLSGTPSNSDIGTHDVVLTLSENGESVTQEFTIEVFAYNSTPQTIFNKDFDDNDLTSGGWTAYSVSGTQAWKVNTYYNSSPYGGYMSGYEDGTAYDNEDWLISPAYNADAYDNDVFSFWSALNYASTVFPTVKYSTNYDGSSAPSSASWTNLSVTLPEGNDWTYVYSGDIDVSNINGSAVYFAFVYTSTSSEASTWEIDDISMVATNPVSVETLANSDIKIYPNPAYDILNINTNEKGQMQIYNIQGQKLYQNEIKSQIEISNFPKGVYFLKIETNKGDVLTGKFIKQ